jgi:NAD(P)H-hydrate epimerase
MEKYTPEKQFIVMTRDQVRAFDTHAINTLGVPGVVLMENAGRSCAELIKEKLENINKPKVCIFCGTGNNGGDGYVIARHLGNYGYQVTVVIFGEHNKIKGDARINLEILQSLNQNIEYMNPDSDDIVNQVDRYAAGADLIVDSLLGTGLTGEVKSSYKQLIEAINELQCPILAVDIPSGLDCDTGEILGAAIVADYTVTFVALKKGFTSERAKQYTGEIYIASIGVNPD